MPSRVPHAYHVSWVLTHTAPSRVPRASQYVTLPPSSSRHAEASSAVRLAMKIGSLHGRTASAKSIRSQYRACHSTQHIRQGHRTGSAHTTYQRLGLHGSDKLPWVRTASPGLPYNTAGTFSQDTGSGMCAHRAACDPSGGAGGNRWGGLCPHQQDKKEKHRR